MIRRVSQPAPSIVPPTNERYPLTVYTSPLSDKIKKLFFLLFCCLLFSFVPGSRNLLSNHTTLSDCQFAYVIFAQSCSLIYA